MKRQKDAVGSASFKAPHAVKEHGMSGAYSIQLVTKCKIREGDVHGKWIVIGPPFLCVIDQREDRKPTSCVVCQCECGTVRVQLAHVLTQRKPSQSCGKCFPGRHGLRKHPLYLCWKAMRARCYNLNVKSYLNYGGRGILVADCWRNDVTAYVKWAIENGWQPGLQIDRRDNDGPYSPDNCRCVSAKTNSRNRRTSSAVTAFGETKTIAEWADDPRARASISCIQQRLKKYTWITTEDAITMPSKSVHVHRPAIYRVPRNPDYRGAR